MAHQRTTRDLIREHPGGPDKTLKLGPVRFRLNPSDYSEDATRKVVTVQTAGGYGRYDYGAAPTTYTISGTVGLAGVNGPGGINDLRQFKPIAGGADKLWPFYFPGEFRGVRFVKIDEFHLTRSASSQYFHDFRLVVSEWPQSVLHPARKVPGAVLGVSLPVGG